MGYNYFTTNEKIEYTHHYVRAEMPETVSTLALTRWQINNRP